MVLYTDQWSVYVGKTTGSIGKGGIGGHIRAVGGPRPRLGADVDGLAALSTTKAIYEKRAVTSKDGTTIGFRQLGHGPGLVIMHGGALGSQHYMKLAIALADEYTVYIPDRRGRGMSGPYGPKYDIEREDEDLGAVVADTGAQYVFGAANGGLIALHASIAVPTIRKVAVFEPVVFVGQPGLGQFKELVARGQQLLSGGDVGAAMASLARDAQDSDPRVKSVAAPYRLLGRVMTNPAICRVLLWADARRVQGDNAALRDLIVAWKTDMEVVKATEGRIGDYKNVTAEVLLICASDTGPLFAGSLDALQKVLPRSTRIELPGVNHGAAQDQGGTPDVIADRLRQFFGTAA